jgi:NADH-quinone oxidoreductase subunit E
VARLTPQNVELAREIIARYPRTRSALIPLLHVAQEQDGWVTDDAMDHIAELLKLTSAEVLGTCSFYEMFKREPVGRYVINVCEGISCMLMGSDALVRHAEEKLGIKVGGTTDDGLITLNGVECIAACDGAPCLAVNYRYQLDVSNAAFDDLVDDLRAGKLDSEIPPHGTTTRVRQKHTAEQWSGKGAEGLPKIWIQL